jgi:hypothetical protein
MSAAWDALYAFAMTLPTLVPGTVVVDWSTPWLDRTAAATSRVPLSGWTDGTHPTADHWQTIAQLSTPSVANLFKRRTSQKDLAWFFTNMTGIGGTLAGSGTISGVASTGTALFGTVDTTIVGAKTVDDKQDIVFSTVSSVISTTMVNMITDNYPVTAAHGRQWVRGFMRIKVIAASNVGTLQLDAINSDGSTQINQNVNASYTTFGTDPALIGKELTLETAAYKLQNKATTAKMQLSIRPGTVAAMTGEVVILETGFMPATEDVCYRWIS